MAYGIHGLTPPRLRFELTAEVVEMIRGNGTIGLVERLVIGHTVQFLPALDRSSVRTEEPTTRGQAGERGER
jgi:hypothetical protein